MSKIPPREKDNDGNRVRATLHHFPLKFFLLNFQKNYFSSLQHEISFQTQKHFGILDPNEPKKHISIEMPQKIDERDFQNSVSHAAGWLS